MAKNFEKRILQKCLRINFYTYIPMNPYNFLKKHYNRCTLVFICSQGPYRAVNSDRNLAVLYCVQEEFLFRVLACIFIKLSTSNYCTHKIDKYLQHYPPSPPQGGDGFDHCIIYGLR